MAVMYFLSAKLATSGPDSSESGAENEIVNYFL